MVERRRPGRLLLALLRLLCLRGAEGPEIVGDLGCSWISSMEIILDGRDAVDRKLPTIEKVRGN